VVSALTEELIKRGHDVTLFATGDSKTHAKLDSIFPKSIRESNISHGEALEWSMLHIGHVYAMEGEFDVIHDHNSTLGMPLANMVKTPTVITLHGAIRESTKRMLKTYRNPNFVSISKDQIKDVDIEKVVTIPNGLDLKGYTHGAKSKGYLLYVGRIAEIKGTHLAINVAEKLNLPLIIAAKLDKVDEEYFETQIKQKLSNPKIKWIGEVNNEERNKLMSEAICLINPITWREPFGLTMIEAMSCECPVVTFDKGSVHEVIINGKTGYITNDISEMMVAVKNIDKLNRKDCREHALKYFNEKLMTDRYEDLYQYLAIETRLKENGILHPRDIEELLTSSIKPLFEKEMSLTDIIL
jgi:glycosyltransferase involved in cell wall biosynthesis